jgi:flagellar biosynthesis protein FlhB
MADEKEDFQKTEEPTPRRREEAREQGRVASSRDVSSFLLLGLAAVATAGVMPMGLRELMPVLRAFLSNPQFDTGEPAALAARLAGVAMAVAMALLVPPGGALLLPILAGLAQHGPLLTPAALRPQLSRVSPAAGLRRLVSANSLVELVRSVVKLLVVGAVAFESARGGFDRILGSVELGVGSLVTLIAELSGRMLLAIAAVTAAFALLDYMWQRHSLNRQLRMSRQEILDEHKHTEGDPIIKQRLKSLRLARARQRMMADVPKSTVVITNPTHVAVALRYVPAETPAPVLLAKGTDRVAARIREVALLHDVPLVENPPLARLLHATVDIGEPIAPAHYQAVAEIIGYVMRLRQRGSS